MFNSNPDNKMDLLQDAEKIVDQINAAWLNPKKSISGDAARIWDEIQAWNIDQDGKLLKKENRGYFISLIAMFLSVEKETIKMCLSTVSKTNRKGSKWDKVVSKFSKQSSQA
jgi:hypothetical protein